MLSSITIFDSRELLKQKILEIFAKRPLSTQHVDFILDSYSEQWRHYHNCDHILRALELFETVGKRLLTEDEIFAIKVMIVFHDVVYKIGREKGWNEYMSALDCSAILSYAGYTQPSLSDLVYEGIVASATHSLENVPPDYHLPIAIFLDIDLFAGFGASWEEFETKTKLIELEFSPLYTSAEYRSGRAQFAKTFLERETIFHTVHFRQYEPIVRESLTRMSLMG